MLIERDAVEQDLHVLDRVDRDAGLADVAHDARVVAVVAAVRREVERDRQAHLPGREVLAVERVRLLGRREPRVLADRPGPVGVHRRPHAPHERLEPGQPADRVEPFEVGRREQRLHRRCPRGCPTRGLRDPCPAVPWPRGPASPVRWAGRSACPNRTSAHPVHCPAQDRCDQAASWKMMPSAVRCPERTTLRPCRIGAFAQPRCVRSGRSRVVNTTPWPCGIDSTVARDCARGRCSTTTNSPPV